MTSTTPATASTGSALSELHKESRMGAMGTTNTTREVRRIDLSDFEARQAEIADQLWDASVEVGFFQLVNHGIALEAVRGAFDGAERFFALPESVTSR